ncbi:MAG TPA: 7TM diverse intracellular signaling domain-containing protein [Chitinophagales bacterium]|nr:7TM diverse intracellular signaling domain-containing protein [Chitinophagales bacterium]HNJ10016.1 7TM diverse intracellular signaling domain-containing protein [Chitinophagales bacterium]
MIRKIGLLIMILCCTYSFAKPIIIDSHTKYISLNKKVFATTFENDTIVQKFEIYNNSNEEQEVFLEIPVENIQFLSIHSIFGVDIFNNERIRDRTLYDRDIVFEYNFSPKSKVIFAVKYLRTDKNKNTEIVLWNKISRIINHQAVDLSRGFFYGFLIVFLLICFVLFLLIREINYLRFFLFLFSGTLYLAVKHNLAYEFLWSKFPTIDYFVKKIALLLYLIFGLNFFRSFIIKRLNDFSLDKYIKLVIFIGVLSIFISLGTGFYTPIIRDIFYLFQYFYIVICVLLIITSFYIAYFKLNDKSVFLFSIAFFASYAFFLFYPVPSSSRYFDEINLKLIFPYLNTFIIFLLISFTVIWKVRQVVKDNKAMRKEIGKINAQQIFGAVTAQLSERKRVGKELHDGIGILMAMAKMKLSSIKTKDNTEKKTLEGIIQQLDSTTQKIRKFSHDLLPPTLIKFGLYIAINDEIDHYNEVKPNPIRFHADDTIKNLDEVSSYIIYNICINMIKYFYGANNYNITIAIFISEYNKHCDIQINYAGNRINTKHRNIINIEKLIGLLQGSSSDELINTFTYKLDLDFPIRLKN